MLGTMARMARKKYINTKDVVRMTRLTTNEVYALIHDGKLKAHKAPKSGWRIEKELIFKMFPDTRVNSSAISSSPVVETTRSHSEIQTTLISDREHYEFLIGNIRKAKRSVLISTANVKMFSIGETEAKASSESFLDILDSLANAGVDIRIICSSPSRGFLEEIEGHEDLMNNPHFTFKTCRRCHMKMVIIDSEIIYIGSANITAAGMGPRIDTRRNFEAGMISSDSNLVEQGIDIFEEGWSKKRCNSCYYKPDCR